MTQVGADRPSLGNRIGQPPAGFAADSDLLRLAWRNTDSFDRYLQRAGPQEAAASAGTAAEPRSAQPEQAPEREDRDTTDRVPAAQADAPPAAEAAEDRVDNRPDGEETETAAASETETEPESADETMPSDESDGAREDDEGKEPKSTASTEQPAPAVVTAPLEQRMLDNEGKDEKTSSDGATGSRQQDAENAKFQVESAKRGEPAASKSIAQMEAARQLDPAIEAPAESAADEQEPDESPQGEKPDGKGKAKLPREPVLAHADAQRHANTASQPTDEPSGRQLAPPGESSSEPDEPSGRSERAAKGGEPNPRRVATAAQNPPPPSSAGNTSARRDVAPADAAAGAVALLTDDNDSTRADEPQAQSAKPIRGPEADPKTDSPLRLTTEARSSPSSARPTASVAEPGQVDRARFVQRVARAFEAMGGRHGVVRLRLHPPELGSLRLEIHVRGGVMHARVEAENAAVRNLLLDQLPQLRDRLAQQDIKIQQFDVALSDHSAGGTSQQAAHQAPGDGQRSGWDASSPRTGDRAAPEEAASPIELPTWPGEGGRLNVLI